MQAGEDGGGAGVLNSRTPCPSSSADTELTVWGYVLSILRCGPKLMLSLSGLGSASWGDHEFVLLSGTLSGVRRARGTSPRKTSELGSSDWPNPTVLHDFLGS